MSETPEPAEPGQNHQDMIDAVLFKRNLDEVFLLLDFISGRPEKQLSSLKIPSLDSGPDLTASQVVTRLASIRYPFPPAQQQEKRSTDASFLLLAKDRLAALAYPARGLTIAYSALFSRTEVADITLHCWPRWLSPKHAVSSGAPDGSRGSLAESAFPGLAIRVHRFNCLYYLLIVTTLVWLLLTTFAYWDVAMGRSTLQRIDRVHVDRATLYQASADVAADGACPEAAVARSVACRRLADLSAAESEAKKDLDNFRTCTGLFCMPLVHVLRWGFILCGVNADTMHDEQSVISLLAVFSNFVLPMMFGVLGTFVAAIRLVQLNVRDSTLAPSDFWNTLLSLPLGMVAGVAVGLFYSPSGAPATGGGSGAVALTLSSSGFGFLAGYGSQTFFDMLDLLKKNAFTINGSTPKPPAT
jgi:hypothetical protein